jgi:arabinogalactan oligomer / maltooligosaccharide transport system substrate-binding protein
MAGLPLLRLPFPLPALLRLLRLRLGPLALLTLLGLLQGCQQLPREVLHLYLVPASTSLSGVSRDDTRQLAAPVLNAFKRLHPDVVLHVRVIPDDQLEHHLRQGQRRGLGPDLLLLPGSLAIALHRQGLIAPPPATPAFREREASILPKILEHVSDQGVLVALPVASEVTLACYDRERVPAAPQTLEQLLALAASGASVGLALDPIGLWWTLGGFAATDALVPVLYGRAAAGGSSRQDTRQSLERWLQWLHQVSLQNRVDIASDHDELLNGLTSGRLAWVPCYSPYLMSLEERMGERLGVSALPAGPDGPASPYVAVRVWAFGRDSSPRQKRLAEDLALLSLNPMLQRQITLANQSTLPVNRFVSIPFASSGRLAAMGQAQEQVRDNGRVLGLPLSADRLRSLMPPIEELTYQVMTGVVSPRQGATSLLELEGGR